MEQISLAYIILTTVLFLFPPELPATGSNMSMSTSLSVHALKVQHYINLCSSFLDYCVAAFGIIIVISVIQWIVDGRKNFTGPRINVDEFPQTLSGVPVSAEPKASATEMDNAEK